MKLYYICVIIDQNERFDIEAEERKGAVEKSVKIYDVVIIGAGASGLMCAAHLDPNKKTLLIDANDKIARKIKISGGGKCNITNKYVSARNYLGDLERVKRTLARFSNADLLDFLKRNGLEVVLRKGAFYFCRKSADEVIELLQKLTRKKELLLGAKVMSVRKEGERFIVETTKGERYAKNVVVASGGASYKSIGASDIALEIAKSFGIHYTPFRPALVGMTLQKEQFWMKELSGISLDVVITVETRRIEGALLFAHRGISGPAVLNASLYWKKGMISVDFLPFEKIEKLVEYGGKKFVSSVLPLPKRFSKAFLRHIGVGDKECAKLTQQERKKLALLHRYDFAPAGNFGFSKAEVSLGGVDTNELLENFEAKKVKGLYFIGEAVDITGELGGYNFQWAFSSAVVCAKGLA